MDEEEVLRRMPPLRSIEGPRIRRETMALTAEAPDYFWTTPASDDHHPEPFREEHGLWAHTICVAQAVLDLFWTYESRAQVVEAEKDHALSAAVLHDQLKAGKDPDEDTSSVSDHDIQMMERVVNESSLPERVGEAVAHHMGASYDGPVPTMGGLNGLVHMADYAGSRSNWRIAVQWELPEELQDKGLAEVGWP